jgi:class 3 adenylate cyclase
MPAKKKTPSKNKKPLIRISEGDLKDLLDKNDSWQLAVKNHDRIIRFGSFFDIAQRPKISDVEIVVCFSDIRGFTNYCHQLQKLSLDNRIQNFLKEYLSIYSYAVLQELWLLEPDGDEDLPETEARIRDLLIPTTYKNLGDGIMLVWELPSTASPKIQGRVTHHILSIIDTIYRNFTEEFTKPGKVGNDAYSKLARQLKIGFGLSRGHAWKLDFGHHLKPDYAGSVVNLAARLQDQARPEGVICEYEFSQSLLDAFVAKRGAKILSGKKIKGLGTQKFVFLQQRDLDDYWKFVLKNLSD